MTRVNFDAQLQAVLQQAVLQQAVLQQAGQTSGTYDSRLNTLREIAQSLQKNLTANPPSGQRIELTVTIEHGHSVNLGQQFNIMFSIPWRPFQNQLFRVYIPSNGDPVHFDFYGEQIVTANGNDEMQDCVLDFIREPDVANHLLTLRQMALIDKQLDLADKHEKLAKHWFFPIWPYAFFRWYLCNRKARKLIEYFKEKK